MNKLTSTDFKSNLPRPTVLAGWLLLIGILLWSYSTVIVRLVGYWLQPDYGHGFFVPVFALVLLLARGRMICGKPKDEGWWFNLFWSKGDWIGALLRSKAVRIGAGVGATITVSLYVLFFPREGSPAGTGILIAGGYGAVLGALALLVAELFRHSERDNQPAFHWSWWGIAFFVVWALMRMYSAFLVVERTDEWSLIPFAAGVTIFLGGWRALRWAWPSIVYLFFLVPLPGALQSQLGPSLQRIGTEASKYAIQTLGIPAVSVGNVIHLQEAQLGVEEACSGIRMLMLFFAICVGAAFLLRCPLWKKIVVVVSAVPIAVLSNVVRITVTAILYETARKWPHIISEEAAGKFFHDGAGWLMMPLALVLLLGLWKLMEVLVIDSAPEGPLALGGSFVGRSGSKDSQPMDNS